MAICYLDVIYMLRYNRDSNEVWTLYKTSIKTEYSANTFTNPFQLTVYSIELTMKTRYLTLKLINCSILL